MYLPNAVNSACIGNV